MNLQSVQVQEDGWSLFSLKNEEAGRCSVCVAPNESTARISFYYRFSNGDLSSGHELLDAHMVPQDLRGPSYQLYLVQQRRDWNNEPLYLMDEWTAYTNGTECGRELNAQGWDFELLQAHNFNVYCLYLAKAIQERCPDYDDKQFKAYLMWNMARVFRLTEGSITSRPARMALVEPEYMTALDLHFGKKKHTCEHPEANFGHWWDDKNKRLVNLTQMGVDNPIMRADAYVERVKTRESARELREFMKKYLGEAFCRKTYGF